MTWVIIGIIVVFAIAFYLILYITSRNIANKSKEELKDQYKDKENHN